ncbi:MAG: pirin family protein [Sphingobacteriaceae bacterium]
MNRQIKQIIPGRMYNMGELKVRQPLPSPELDYLDPFVLLHHGHMFFDPNATLPKSGVGPHPHKGFAPVTFLFKGGVHHRDSRGNSKEVKGGGTQWMHAGMGIVHSERPTDFEQELIQMWINSPKKNKNDQTYYHPLTKEETPFFISEDKRTTINVISGDLLNIKGPIPTLSPIISATIHTEKDALVSFEIPETHNAFLYLLDGCISINGKEITGKNFIEFERSGSKIEFTSIDPTRALFMSGEPIGEKIVTHGPFVMNNETEIMEAYRDYRMGKMGVLIEE